MAQRTPTVAIEENLAKDADHLPDVTPAKFERDVDVAGHLKPGKNSITLRIHNPHHFGGMFRRPFLYRAVGQ